MQDLFTQALGINSPWFISNVEFNNKKLMPFLKNNNTKALIIVCFSILKKTIVSTF